jgi:hypothetical protein
VADWSDEWQALHLFCVFVFRKSGVGADVAASNEPVPPKASGANFDMATGLVRLEAKGDACLAAELKVASHGGDGDGGDSDGDDV